MGTLFSCKQRVSIKKISNNKEGFHFKSVYKLNRVFCTYERLKVKLNMKY